MPHTFAPAVLGTMLAASLALSGTEAQAATASSTPELSAAASDTEQAPAIALVRGDDRTPFDSLTLAFQAAQSGDAIEISGSIALDEPVVLDAGRAVTLRAVGACTITRAGAFPQEGGKTAGMFRLRGGAQLTLETIDPDSCPHVIDGQDTDSQEAIVTLRERSTFTMRAGTAIEGALCSWKPWAAVYVHGGTFVLDGGELRDSFAMRNAAVAVERGAAFEMRAGSIHGMRTSYSESIVWTKGDIRMTGGVIEGNSSNVSSDGVVHVLDGGSLSFTGGTIGDNAPNNTFGVRVDGGGSLELGGTARLAGTDRVNLAQGGSMKIADALQAHTTDDPIEVVLSGTWDPGAVVAAAASPEVARDALTKLSVRSAGATEKTASVGIDPADDSRLALASADTTALFDVLDNPFADNLGLTMRDELTAPDAFESLHLAVDAYFGGLDTPESRVRRQQIEDARRYAAYLAANRDALADSVQELSQLGDPIAEARRTQQGYQFDNLDATGLYLKPGQVNRITVYVDADDPGKLSVAWRQVGMTDTNSYPSLNLGQHSKLSRGANHITVDLTGKTYASMLYLRNDSTDNEARVRIEATDAPGLATRSEEDGADAPQLGTSLGAHPFYEHDPEHPERFWDFVLEVRAHAARVETDGAADMTLIQMGDEGHAQFALRATAMAQAYAGIASGQDAIAYIEKSNAAIQGRLEFYWAFDGFDASEQDGPNAITPARVHTAFTRTVSNPSTMYAYGRYFHMPESSAASFLSGADMYGWGMSHEYGHMLDNNVIAVAEETNNLYSIAGARRGGIMASQAAGKSFDPAAYYHVNAMGATRRRDTELARMAADPEYVPDWMNGGEWGTYIWTHVTTWWNGLHFFDDWDYSDYDFSASPYQPETAADVGRYGAYGATLRILRGDPAAVKTIEDLASNAASGVKYNRMAVAFTMGTGYNFAEYLYEIGERDLAPQVLEWCARYPSMPRKVHYFSLNTDAAIINGAKTYEQIVGTDGTVEPEVAIETDEDSGTVRITASMPTDELARATTAWELYRDGELIGFSRDGAFQVDAGTRADTADEGGAGADEGNAYRVVAYDVRLNPSTEFAGEDGGADEGPGGGTEEGPDGDGSDGGAGGSEDGDNGGGGETPDGEGGEDPGDGSGDEDGDEDERPGGGADNGKPEGDDGDDPDEQPGGGATEDGDGTDQDPDDGPEPDDGPDGDTPDGDDADEGEDGPDADGDAGPGEPDSDPAPDDPEDSGGGDLDTGGDQGGSDSTGQLPAGSTTSGERETEESRTLARTADTSLLAPVIAALGGTISLVGAAIASRLGKRR